MKGGLSPPKLEGLILEPILYMQTHTHAKQSYFQSKPRRDSRIPGKGMNEHPETTNPDETSN